jgi:phospholipase/carboxylesterase
LGYGWGDDPRTQSLVEDYLIRSVEHTRRHYHIHSERIYLAGFAEGATVAYRMGLQYPERFAGVISLNGLMPREGRPLFRLPQLRELRVFIGHGIANVFKPLSSARQDHRQLYTAGLDVRIHTYPTTHRLHTDMLRDIDRWIMERVNGE